jgi:formate dehydrogenase assembly factor FdhD
MVRARWWAYFNGKHGRSRALLTAYTGTDIDAAMFHARSQYGRRLYGVFSYDVGRHEKLDKATGQWVRATPPRGGTR